MLKYSLNIDTKNDFANWIEHVFHEKTLGERIRKLRYKVGVAQELKSWVEEHND